MIKFLSNLLILFILLTGGEGDAATFNVSDTPELRQALINASGNGKDDTIILNAGIYKITDDGSGAFEFIDIEPNNLIIKSKKGLNSTDVILDGDYIDSVFKFMNPRCPECTITLERISVINGKTGGIDSDYNLIISGSRILNSAGEKGISSRGGVAATSSIIIE
jgi:hypothetical protein